MPIVYFFYPETAGRSLEEINMIFVQSKSIFDTVRVARKLPRAHLIDLASDEKGHVNFIEVVEA